MSDTEGENDDILSQVIISKYRLAAGIAQEALRKVVSSCTPGRTVLELAELGDTTMTQLAKDLKEIPEVEEEDRSKVKKGIAFPTSIAINECVGNFSPDTTEERKVANNDVVKIDLAAHVDGYVACVSHTVIVTKQPVTDVRADVVEASWVAADAVAKLLRPGNKVIDVSAVITKIAAAYGVFPVDGVLTHQMKRYVIDGNKVIPNLLSVTSPPFDARAEVEVNDVFCVDVVMTSADPRRKKGTSTSSEAPEEGAPTRPDAPPAPREQGDKYKPTIFKRNVDQTYMLKLKTSRQVLQEVQQKHKTFPFSIRALQTKVPRMGIKEMLEHDMLSVYPPLFSKEGCVTAQFKMTVLVTEAGPIVVCGGLHSAPLLAANLKSDKIITDPEVLGTLRLPLTAGPKEKAKKKKKKSKKKAADEEEAEAGEEEAEPEKKAEEEEPKPKKKKKKAAEEEPAEEPAEEEAKPKKKKKKAVVEEEPAEDTLEESAKPKKKKAKKEVAADEE